MPSRNSENRKDGKRWLGLKRIGLGTKHQRFSKESLVIWCPDDDKDFHRKLWDNETIKLRAQWNLLRGCCNFVSRSHGFLHWSAQRLLVTDCSDRYLWYKELQKRKPRNQHKHKEIPQRRKMHATFNKQQRRKKQHNSEKKNQQETELCSFYYWPLSSRILLSLSGRRNHVWSRDHVCFENSQ